MESYSWAEGAVSGALGGVGRSAVLNHHLRVRVGDTYPLVYRGPSIPATRKVNPPGIAVDVEYGEDGQLMARVVATALDDVGSGRAPSWRAARNPRSAWPEES